MYFKNSYILIHNFNNFNGLKIYLNQSLLYLNEILTKKKPFEQNLILYHK